MKKIWLWLKIRIGQNQELTTDKGLIVLLPVTQKISRVRLTEDLLKFGFKQVYVILVYYSSKPIQFIPVDIPHVWEEENYSKPLTRKEQIDVATKVVKPI